mgnify:CR=1 FL=1
MAINMKNRVLLFFQVLCVLLYSCSDKEELIVIETPYGSMTAVLFDEAPLHKENFLKLTKNGDYDSVLFHRVIEDFMIQTGDLATGSSKEAVDYTLPAEFVPDKYIHQKGALAAARVGDARNPEKRSSGSQFYIVDGTTFDDAGLDERAKRRAYLKLYGFFDRMLKSKRFPELTEKYYYHVNKLEEDSTYDFYAAQEALIFQSLPVIEKEFGSQVDPGFEDWAKEIYATTGGSPHLDGEYTVFGQVIDGLEVIDKIAALETDQADKPLNEVRMQVKVIKMSKDEISQTYNYKFANFVQ